MKTLRPVTSGLCWALLSALLTLHVFATVIVVAVAIGATP